MLRLSIVPLLVFSALVTAGCDETPDSPPVGSLGVTTSMAAPQFSTADAWAIKVDRLLVHVASVSVAGSDLVLAASATAQIVDQVAPGPKPLVVAGVRTARAWEEVSLTVAPATTEATVIAPATDVDKEMMVKEGYAIWLEATATKGQTTRALKLGFVSSTVHQNCAGEKDGAFIRGLVVPANGDDTADVVMDPGVFFVDDLKATGALPRAEVIAAADANNDGIVTMNELRVVSLEQAKLASSGGLYGVGDTTGVTDLGGFLEEQSRRLVSSFRAKGACIPQPAPPAAP